MRHLSSKEIQSISNDILKHIREVCDRINVPFFLAYGTVIGAIRHKGFIPWDDDIDIYMYRSDYEKFKQIVIEENTQFKLLDVEIASQYYMPQVKLMDRRTRMDWHVAKNIYPIGVWVDIYVLDNVPDDDRVLRSFQRKLNFLQSCYAHSLYRPTINSLKSFVSFILLCWTKIIGPRFFSKIIVSMAKRYNNQSTRRIAPSSFTASSREEAVLDREIIGNGVLAEFEGEGYLVPEKTDAYLRHFYGNYMQLPPEEKRISNHTADFYLLEYDE